MLYSAMAWPDDTRMLRAKRGQFLWGAKCRKACNCLVFIACIHEIHRQATFHVHLQMLHSWIDGAWPLFVGSQIWWKRGWRGRKFYNTRSFTTSKHLTKNNWNMQKNTMIHWCTSGGFRMLNGESYLRKAALKGVGKVPKVLSMFSAVCTCPEAT